MKAKYVGMLSAFLATICCVGPLLLVALGLGSGAAVVGRYHWFVLIAGIAILAWTWVKYLREKTEKTICDCVQRPKKARRSGLITLLIITVLVLSFAGVNISRYMFASTPVAAQTPTQLAKGLNRVVIPVEGLTCIACEIPVGHALRRIDGVKAARVSAATKTATVDYEPAKTNPDQFVAAINSAGYRAELPNK